MLARANTQAAKRLAGGRGGKRGIPATLISSSATATSSSSSPLSRPSAAVARRTTHSSSSHSSHSRSHQRGWRKVWMGLAAGAGVGVAVAYTLHSQRNEQLALCAAAPSATAAAPTGPAAAETYAASIAAVHQELLALLSPDQVSIDAGDLSSHASDAYSYHKEGETTALGAEPNRPLGIVTYPLSTQQVSDIVKICAKHKVKMIPYGSGTSLEGHTSAPHGGVCIDMSRMHRITALHASDLDCVVEAGISWNNLNAELKPHGLFFPVDPGPGASIGGMVATSCSGTNAVRYGTMKPNVLNVTVVMPDGSIVKTGNRARKSSAGYDLTRLIIGSEGTLGIVTEITLRLQNIPEATAVATCAFDSLTHASESVIELMQRGVRVGCVELLDDGCIEAVNAYAGLAYPPKPATLFFKFHGSHASVADDIEQASQIVRKHGAGPFTFSTEEQARDQLWEARKGALWGCIAYRPGCEAWTTDVCVPISRMAECIEQTKADLLELTGAASPSSTSTLPPTAPRSSFPFAVVGHVGDGNFHVIMMLDPNNPLELATAQLVNERMVRRAIAMEGTCTGEHGVGVGKKKYLEAELGVGAMQLMRQIKKSIDPHNLMNPGKVFDLEPQTNVDANQLLTNQEAHLGHACKHC